MESNEQRGSEPATTAPASRWEPRIPAGIDERLASIPDHALKVLLVLLRHVNAEGFCWPSFATLAAATGKSVRAVQRAVASLCELGIASYGPFPDGWRRGRGQGKCFHLPACVRGDDFRTLASGNPVTRGAQQVRDKSVTEARQADRTDAAGQPDADGSANRTPTSGISGRACRIEQTQGTPQGNQPNRTSAESTKDAQTVQSRESGRCLNAETLAEVEALAADVRKRVACNDDLPERAAFLAILGPLSRSDVLDAAEATYNVGPQNPAGYFRSCLQEKAVARGLDIGRELARVRLPKMVATDWAAMHAAIRRAIADVGGPSDAAPESEAAA